MSKPIKNIFPDDITLDYRVCCFIRKIYFALIVFVYDPFAWNDEKNCIGLVLTCVSLQSITKCDIFLKEESTIYH